MTTTARDWLAARGADVPPALQQRMAAAVNAVAAAGNTAAATGLEPASLDTSADAIARTTTGTALTSDAELPAQLAAAALHCLRDALRHGDSRAAALHLLAADGLITYACAAAAQLGNDALMAVQEQLGPTQLASLLTDRSTP